MKPAFSLLEVLIALVLIGILAALLSRGVIVQGRAAAEVSARTEARRVLRAAAAPLIGELRQAIIEEDAALSLVRDTLRIRTVIASGAACVAHDGRLALLSSGPVAPLAVWHSVPDARDALLLLQPHDPGDTCDRWSETSVVGASVASYPPPCAGTAGGGSTLILAPGSPASAPAGDTTLVQAVRRVAWRLTNSADGWYLSRTRCDAASGIAAPVCDPTQPVAGPLLSPAAGGLRLRPLAADGTPLPAALQSSARAVELQLVAPVAVRRAGSAPHESLHVVVPLPRPCS
ncbi:MAG TPA: type II secretion system protein [Gemmatimonadales bacterium]|nr:type II secretion system protein [Gemmatimonadales bacterium]